MLVCGLRLIWRRVEVEEEAERDRGVHNDKEELGEAGESFCQREAESKVGCVYVNNDCVAWQYVWNIGSDSPLFHQNKDGHVRPVIQWMPARARTAIQQAEQIGCSVC